MKSIKQLEKNVEKSFFNVKNDINSAKKQMEVSKKEIAELYKAVKMQNDTIKQIYENQKHLLLRVKEIEKALKIDHNPKKIVMAKL